MRPGNLQKIVDFYVSGCTHCGAGLQGSINTDCYAKLPSYSNLCQSQLRHGG